MRRVLPRRTREEQMRRTREEQMRRALPHLLGSREEQMRWTREEETGSGGFEVEDRRRK